MKTGEERSTQLESRTVEITKFEQQRENILKKEREEKVGRWETRECNKRPKFMSES